MYYFMRRLLKKQASGSLKPALNIWKRTTKFIEDIRILHDKVELLLRENGDLKAEVATL